MRIIKKNTLHIDIEGGFGGSSRSLSLIVSHLDKKKFKPEIWLAKNGPAIKRNQKNKIKCKINKNIGYIIPIKQNNLKNILVSIPKILKLMFLALKIESKSKKIDLLHLNHEGLLPLAFFLRVIGSNLPIIIHKRSIFPINFYTKQFSKLYRFVNGIIFITKNEEKNFLDYNLTSSLKIKNQIIHNASPKILLEKNISTEKDFFKAIFLGNYDTKDPDRILDLSIITKQQGLPIKYFIYGKENRKSLIQKKKIVDIDFLNKTILEHKLNDTVFLMGHTDKPEKAIMNANILIRPSRRNDPWGRDIIEGMSSGLLVIATGDNQVFIKNKINGLIFKTWDNKAISKVLKYYLNNKKELEKLKINAKEFAKREFDPKKQGQKTTEYFMKFI